MLDLTAVFASFPVLETERCILRAPTLEDAPGLFGVYGDARVTRYMGHRMVSLDDAVQRIRLFQTAFQEQTGIRWMVTRRDTGEVIGHCAVWHLAAAHSRAELGYALAHDYWGQGIMTEVVGAAVDYAFTTMRLHSLKARIDPDNTGSRRVVEKLGFVQEGYFREDYYFPAEQRFGDTAVLSLLASAWAKQKSPQPFIKT